MLREDTLYTDWSGKGSDMGPLPPNENQTMFKGTIKIFLQRFIYLAEGDQIKPDPYIDIWNTRILNTGDKNLNQIDLILIFNVTEW